MLIDCEEFMTYRSNNTRKGLTPTPPLSARDDQNDAHQVTLARCLRKTGRYWRDRTMKMKSRPFRSIGTVAHALISGQADKRIAAENRDPEFRTNEAKACATRIWRFWAKVVVKEEAYQAAVRMASVFEPKMSVFEKEPRRKVQHGESWKSKTIVAQINGLQNTDRQPRARASGTLNPQAPNTRPG